MDIFDKAVDHVMLYEVGGLWYVNHPAVANGLIDTATNRKAVGYVNDPDDKGGETKFGVAKNANPDLNITTLTWEQAKRVYYRRYWLQAHCDELSAVSNKIAFMIFDAAVNHGVSRAVKLLQQALCVTVDGDFGPKTLAAVKQCNADQIVATVAKLRRDFYRQIVSTNPSQIKFLNGWLARINNVEVIAHAI